MGVENQRKFGVKHKDRLAGPRLLIQKIEDIGKTVPIRTGNAPDKLENRPTQHILAFVGKIGSEGKAITGTLKKENGNRHCPPLDKAKHPDDDQQTANRKEGQQISRIDSEGDQNDKKI